MANLGSFAKEHLGMMDAIVASRGRAFAGTYYSTFSGYITRMRGYHGMSKYTSWYSWNPVKFEMQTGPFFSSSNEFKREYPIGWVGIDGDERVVKENEDDNHIGETDVVVVKPVIGDELHSVIARNQKAAAMPKDMSQEAKSADDNMKGPGVVHDQKASATLKKEVIEGKEATMNEVNAANGNQIVRDASNVLNESVVKEKQPNLLDVNQENNAPAHGIRSLEESMINVLGFLPSEDEKLKVADDGTTLYTVFSTDCGPFQHWQSYLLFFSAMRIKQAGFITRIASGCTDEQKQEANKWHQEVSKHQYGTFFTGSTAISISVRQSSPLF